MFKIIKTIAIAVSIAGGLSIQAEAQSSRYGGQYYTGQYSQGLNGGFVNQNQFNNRQFVNQRGFSNIGFNQGFNNRVQYAKIRLQPIWK